MKDKRVVLYVEVPCEFVEFELKFTIQTISRQVAIVAIKQPLMIE